MPKVTNKYLFNSCYFGQSQLLFRCAALSPLWYPRLASPLALACVVSGRSSYPCSMLRSTTFRVIWLAICCWWLPRRARHLLPLAPSPLIWHGSCWHTAVRHRQPPPPHSSYGATFGARRKLISCTGSARHCKPSDRGTRHTGSVARHRRSTHAVPP